MKNKIQSLVCWLFGHKKGGSWDPNYRHFMTSRGQWATGGWRYHCDRCHTKEEFPDIRSLYWRTVRVWITKTRNRWHYRNFDRV